MGWADNDDDAHIYDDDDEVAIGVDNDAVNDDDDVNDYDDVDLTQVGRRHIKNSLIASHPDRFAYPIPHTTRWWVLWWWLSQ